MTTLGSSEEFLNCLMCIFQLNQECISKYIISSILKVNTLSGELFWRQYLHIFASYIITDIMAVSPNSPMYMSLINICGGGPQLCPGGTGENNSRWVTS